MLENISVALIFYYPSIYMRSVGFNTSKSTCVESKLSPTTQLRYSDSINKVRRVILDIMDNAVTIASKPDSLQKHCHRANMFRESGIGRTSLL